jgi:murein DD-endopeptidase MepM/ murein hydrolase activator NlpD
VAVTATGQSTVVLFTDCATGREYPSTEPTYLPHDPIVCVYAGVVQEAVTEEALSDFGRHVVVAHRWPTAGTGFLTLYGHLAEVTVGVGQPVQAGQSLGRMGQSSRIADARNWMRVAPHLHLEVRTGDGAGNYDPLAFLERFAAPERQSGKRDAT